MLSQTGLTVKGHAWGGASRFIVAIPVSDLVTRWAEQLNLVLNNGNRLTLVLAAFLSTNIIFNNILLPIKQILARYEILINNRGACLRQFLLSLLNFLDHRLSFQSDKMMLTRAVRSLVIVVLFCNLIQVPAQTGLATITCNEVRPRLNGTNCLIWLDKSGLELLNGASVSFGTSRFLFWIWFRCQIWNVDITRYLLTYWVDIILLCRDGFSDHLSLGVRPSLFSRLRC